jgi:type I restriction enzyme S subunit
MSNLPIPLPPLAEQRRIVAKIDELMALCDKLEDQQQERKNLCQITRNSILQSLSNAEDLSELEVAWARTNANLDIILDSEQGLIDLEFALTKLAVRGFLSNWINEHPPLDEIQAECSALKQEYLNRGWLRRRKPVSSKLYKNDTYPPHWVITPLDEVAVIIGGITKGHRLRGEDVRSCVYLSVANVQRGFFDLREMKHIEVPAHQFEKYRVEDGDLLIAEGGDWDKVGRTAIWAGEVPNCLHQNHIFKARVPSSLLLNEWVELVLNSEIGRNYFAGVSKQTTNLASINMTQLRSFPLPIPPLAEQIVILRKVNVLLSICQKLKQQRLDLSNVGQMLVSAVVSSITGIQIEDKEKMKVPKTELVSNLRINVSPANSERAPLVAILIRNNGEMPAKTLWQASGLEIDAFYQQLKTEMARGWIVQPEVAYVREVEAS